MFHPGQVGRTWFIQYPDLTWILYCIIYLIMASGCDQSNELNVLDGDDGSVLSDYLDRLTVQLGYFDCLVLG